MNADTADVYLHTLFGIQSLESQYETMIYYQRSEASGE